MSATATRLRTGDVVEIEINGETASAMVLLATIESVILDRCDGSTPFVVRQIDLGPVRVFNPATA